MEVYVAILDYEKEREDVLSFKKGDKFQIASKKDLKWWAAYTLETRDFGYIPRKCLEPFVDVSEGKEAQRLLHTPAGENKKVAMVELKRKIPRIPAASSHTMGEEEEENLGEISVIKPLTDISHIPEDCVQVEPKKLSNPHLESRQHKQLNKEIRLGNARGGGGGIQSTLGTPELQQVMRRRKPDAEGNMGSIKPQQSGPSGSTSPGGELGKQLARRTQLLEQLEKEKVEDEEKPEFLKVALRKAQQC